MLNLLRMLENENLVFPKIPSSGNCYFKINYRIALQQFCAWRDGEKMKPIMQLYKTCYIQATNTV